MNRIVSANSPVHAIAHAAARLRPAWLVAPRHVMTTSVEARGSNVKRDLSNGAIVGTVVGVVVALALLALCLYPVILYLARRRHRRSGDPFSDAENAFHQGHHGRYGQRTCKTNALHHKSHPRSSSPNSSKHGADLLRGEFAETERKEISWSPQDGDFTQLDGNVRPSTHAPIQIEGTLAFGNNLPHGHGAEFTPFPFYMPASMPDDNPGVLKGTSADYYSPSIPSEAFGMVAEPETETETETVEPTRTVSTVSRGSSFKLSMKSFLRSRSSRQDSSVFVLSEEGQNQQKTSPRAHPEGGLGKVANAVYSARSPAQQLSSRSSKTTTQHAAPMPTAEANADDTSPFSFQSMCVTRLEKRAAPENAIEAVQASQISPSLPPVPAPGTVNPMDIMPASTESELWYRTEHQLLATSLQPLPDAPFPGDQTECEGVSPTVAPLSSLFVTSPSQAAAQTMQQQEPHAPVEQNEAQGPQDVEMGDETQTGSHGHQHQISPSLMTETDRHPSYPSDQSTPFPWSHSTGPPTENTPSTQLDSPSPCSMNSSDFRPSASPPSVTASPRTGVYRCDQTGCGQVFDQPHKLRHHQRYHSRDHKCPYRNCGKGFGTKTHLQRHINDRHEKKKKFHCAVQGCDYSKSGGKGFPRKDNWKRHMTRIHHMDHQHLPEPIEVDQEMNDT